MSAFRQALRVYADSELSPAAQAARLRAVAHNARDTAISSGVASPLYDTFADGSQVPDDSNARRTITYRYNYSALAALYALGFIRLRSPIDTGRFRAAFMFAVNGRPIPAAAFNPASVPYGAEIYLYNPLPYARKINNQYAGPVKLNYSVPPGVFDDTARATQRKYSGVIRAKAIGTIVIPGQYTRKKGKSVGRVVETPAVLITANG